MKENTLDVATGHYYGENASTYDKIRHKQKRWSKEHKIIERILKEKKLEKKDFSVIDVPVGTGRFFSLYQELDIEALGIDVSSDMLDIAASQRKRMDYDISLKFGDARFLPVPDAAYDVMICLRFINFIEEKDIFTVVREQVRVTREEIIVSTWVRPDVPTSAPGRFLLYIRLSMARILELLRAIGLITKKVFVHTLIKRDIVAKITSQSIKTKPRLQTLVHSKEQLVGLYTGAGAGLTKEYLLEQKFDGSSYYILVFNLPKA